MQSVINTIRTTEEQLLISICRGEIHPDRLPEAGALSDSSFAYAIDNAIRSKTVAAVEALLNQLSQQPRTEGQTLGNRLNQISLKHGLVHSLRISQFLSDHQSRMQVDTPIG